MLDNIYFQIVVVVVYIFRHFNQYKFTDFNKNNNEEERSSGTTGIGVSQKDLQIGKKTKEVENLVEKRARALQGCRLYLVYVYDLIRSYYGKGFHKKILQTP